jgi:ribonuclease P protein component
LINVGVLRRTRMPVTSARTAPALPESEERAVQSALDSNKALGTDLRLQFAQFLVGLQCRLNGILLRFRQRGGRLTDAYFSVSVLAHQESHARLGLAIATRTFGTAVARNRIKRLARESFRLNQHDLPPVDVTVSARDAARVAALADLRISLEKHWKNISLRW